MSWPMRWHDSVTATALAALAERTTTTAPQAADTPWSWNPHDVWLTRVQQPRDVAIQSSMTAPTTQPRRDTALRD